VGVFGVFSANGDRWLGAAGPVGSPVRSSVCLKGEPASSVGEEARPSSKRNGGGGGCQRGHRGREESLIGGVELLEEGT